MLISLKTEYGIKALVYLAINQPNQLPLSKIAKEQGIPPKFLERILNDLRKGGLVESTRGKSGGYYLSKSAEQIRLLDIVKCLEGAVAVSSGNRIKTANRRQIDRVIGRIYQRLNSQIERDLKQVSLAELAREASGNEGSYNYYI